MTRHEIEKRIEDLRDKRFALTMADHWDREDFDLDAKWLREIAELKKELEKA